MHNNKKKKNKENYLLIVRFFIKIEKVILRARILSSDKFFLMKAAGNNYFSISCC
ncbi:Hypothetical protein GbCGDNIH9_8405 [Granulibacter bethesdensis]|uniref:Uncharacterized protein n=1 Tax=Granulibacter bethesdensis TaxID=364410 RepID=A0AAC9P7J1_9PROT|nr:Hypothetical protein GbCGDNIH9_8405 [Granulibacter bethesdensis]APH61130.1 Hypothetical protein GbCGDNIH8_8405 [Granulibacter bethesdensis]